MAKLYIGYTQFTHPKNKDCFAYKIVKSETEFPDLLICGNLGESYKKVRKGSYELSQIDE